MLHRIIRSWYTAVDGWAITFGTARRAWAGCSPAKSPRRPRRCTKCNSLPINGQCTNHCIQCIAIMMIGCSAVLMRRLKGSGDIWSIDVSTTKPVLWQTVLIRLRNNCTVVSIFCLLSVHFYAPPAGVWCPISQPTVFSQLDSRPIVVSTPRKLLWLQSTTS